MHLIKKTHSVKVSAATRGIQRRRRSPGDADTGNKRGDKKPGLKGLEVKYLKAAIIRPLRVITLTETLPQSLGLSV